MQGPTIPTEDCEFSSSMLEGLIFKVAGATEIAAALRLRQRVYEEEFGHVPVDDLDATAYHLIAREVDGELVAALRIVGPHQRPFDLESHVRLADLIPPERAVAFIGRQCVRRDYRSVSRRNFVPMGMMKLAYTFARKAQLTDLLTYAYPNLHRFYRAAFFETLIDALDHPVWGMVRVMHLDLEALAVRCADSPRPLAQFLFNVELPNILV